MSSMAQAFWHSLRRDLNPAPSSRPMRPAALLFLDHAPALGGAEHSLLMLLEHLDRSRWRPHLACTGGPLAERATALDVPVHVVPMPRLRGRPMALWRLARGGLAVTRIVGREDVVLLLSNTMRASFYAAAAARLTGRPLIWHVRDILRERWYMRLMCRWSARAIAVSGAAAAPVPCGQTTVVVPDGVDPRRFDPALDGRGFRAELQIESDAPLVGCVGWLQDWKGQDRVLRAAALVARRRPDARFVIVGASAFDSGRDHFGELKALAATLGLAGRVIFTGHREDVPRVLAALDLLVHGARAEPFGRVLVEAMAMARPVVAFADGGVPEIVVDGQTGRLAPPGDVEALAAAVLDLLANPDGRRQMGERARARAVSHFDVRPLTRRMEAEFESVLQEGR
jgi:glycosyltransferase involved in cell wall biosynthesis